MDNLVCMVEQLGKYIDLSREEERRLKRIKHSFQVVLCKGLDIVERAKERCNGHSKRFKYIMSHKTGKIEILGIIDNEIYFKYHQAKKRKNLGRIFKRKVDEKAGWLDDFKSFSYEVESSEVESLDGISFGDMSTQRIEIVGGENCWHSR